MLEDDEGLTETTAQRPQGSGAGSRQRSDRRGAERGGDPEAWSRPVSTDEPDESGESDDESELLAGHAPPPPIERFHRSSIGAVLAAGMFGLRDVIEPPKDETPAIVEDWSGGEPFNDPYVMRLDPDHPEDSIVMIRPWLKPPPETTD